MINSIQDVVANDLCISCGACSLYPGRNSVSMAETSEGIYIPSVELEAEETWGSGEEFAICPGKGYPIKQIAEELFPTAVHEDVDIGRWQEAYVTRSLSPEVLEKASSGGVMTAIARYALDTGLVQGVLVTRMTYGSSGPRPESFIATSFAELVEAQGSKYCPVPVFSGLSDMDQFNGKLLFIGTPCQIAALRLMQQQNPLLREKIVLTIGNFCGGYRDLRETDKILERAGAPKDKVRFLRYRGGGQPGSMLIRSDDTPDKQLPYPDYARMTGVIKYQRCRLCVDATAELADFACGDAWIPEYLRSGKSWSIVVARSETSLSILRRLVDQGCIETKGVSLADIKRSQEGNLTSKKTRQRSRMFLYRLLAKEIPYFDGGYHANGGGLLFELKVHLSHSFFSILEKVGLYKVFSKVIGRYPKG